MEIAEFWLMMSTYDRWLYLGYIDVAVQQKDMEYLMSFLGRLEKQQDLAIYRPYEVPNRIPDQAIGREVRDLHNHMSVCNLQRLQDAHSIIRDVSDRQQAITEQCCESKELLNFCFNANRLIYPIHFLPLATIYCL